MKTTRIIASCLIGLALAGCANETPSLSVRSEQTDAQYVAQFDRALFTQSSDGQVDLILLAGAPGADAQIGSPLQARAGQSVQQVVHLRVLWAPRKSIRIDSPSASNTTVHWHVIADRNDRLTYSGACWTRVKIDGDEAEVDLRNATISISSVNGNIADPLKRARLEGKFTARRSDSAVRSYLGELATLERASPRTAMANP